MKQQKGTQKSTYRIKKNHHITHRSSPPSEVPRTIRFSPSYPNSIRFICRVYAKRYEEVTGADRLHILNRTIEEIRKKMYMKEYDEGVPVTKAGSALIDNLKQFI